MLPRLPMINGPATTCVVDEQHAEELSDQGDDGADTLVFEGVIYCDAHLSVDNGRVVLNGRDTSHLDGRLEGAAQEKAAER